MIEKAFDRDEDLDENLEEFHSKKGFKCPCFEKKHWDFAYYEGTYASRKLRKIWRENGCPLHHPADTEECATDE